MLLFLLDKISVALLAKLRKTKFCFKLILYAKFRLRKWQNTSVAVAFKAGIYFKQTIKIINCF